MPYWLCERIGSCTRLEAILEMVHSPDAKLTNREKFVVWFTAMLMMPNESLDHDSKERVIRCIKTTMVGGMVDEMCKSRNTRPDQKTYEQTFDQMIGVQAGVVDELDMLMKFLEACYGPSKDGRQFSDFKN